jgi:hypothetical protein
MLKLPEPLKYSYKLIRDVSDQNVFYISWAYASIGIGRLSFD